jgi:hypothetical protein
MPSRSSEVSFVVEVGPNKRAVGFYCRPSPQELNFIFVVAEALGTEVHWDDLCYRLKASVNAIRLLATKLRKKLAGEWVVDVVNNRGVRLLYAPYQTDDVDKLAPTVRRIRLYQQHDAFQKGIRVPSESTRRLISRSLTHSSAV